MLPPRIHIGRPLRPLPDGASAPPTEVPDWVQADPIRIERQLQRALRKPHGGWMVLGATRWFSQAPSKLEVDGQELVVWTGDDGRVRAAPDACPHMGASLSCGAVRQGQIVCPWHGLALSDKPHGRWRPLETYNDGVLSWVRMGPPDPSIPIPILPTRPVAFLEGVVRLEATCEPRDIIQNRLDPWHGAHFHPHSFAELRVIDETEDDITVRVAYRAAGPLCVEVDAKFHCPDARTIVMTIVDGDGKGSVVETHATPIRRDRTAVIEATLAASDRKGFAVIRGVSPLVRPWMERRAKRLWVEDCAYAERLYAMRRKRAIEVQQKKKPA